jgi:hypothetical protein
MPNAKISHKLEEQRNPTYLCILLLFCVLTEGKSHYQVANIILYVSKSYGTIRKVAGSIPDGLLGFYIDLISPAALWSWDWLSLEHKWVLGISHVPACNGTTVPSFVLLRLHLSCNCLLSFLVFL